MEGLRRSIGWPAAALVLTCTVLVMMPIEASAMCFIVGANMGWTSNVNYAIWTKGKHFHLSDWLSFMYDRHHMNVLEVNKRDYMNCNSNHPLHNWTACARRDVVLLNVTKTYYFIRGKGFCRRGCWDKIGESKKINPKPKARVYTVSLNRIRRLTGVQEVLFGVRFPDTIGCRFTLHYVNRLRTSCIYLLKKFSKGKQE